MCSALHALIVTATIFADTLTQIIYRIEAQETKQALAPWDSESQAGCHIASCDTQKTLIYDGWSQPITHLQRSGKHSRAVLCCWAHSSDPVRLSSMKARKECAPDYPSVLPGFLLLPSTYAAALGCFWRPRLARHPLSPGTGQPKPSVTH